MDCEKGFLLVAAALLGAAGCKVFDESLVPREAGSTSTSEAISVTNYCSTAIPATPDNTTRQLTLVQGGDPTTGEDIPCLPHASQQGRRSYFFAFHSQEPMPQKWHVHTPTDNVWLYIASDCRAVCDPNGGFESSKAEHLSFLASEPGTYWVGVSVPNDPAAALPEVLLQHDSCHDDIIQHGEACDSKTDPLCFECKRILQSSPSIGKEPNDSPLDANIIPVSASTAFVVRKSVGKAELSDAGYGNVVGINPYDFFGLKADPGDFGKTVHAELTFDVGSSCDRAHLSAVDLADSWFDSKNDALPGHICMCGDGGASGTCCNAASAPMAVSGTCTKTLDVPYAADASQASLSSHYIRVAAFPGEEVYYTLSVSLQ